MILSDTSIKRPVLATVFSIMLIAFGMVAFERLPLREYPDIDPPVVSIETTYRGASAAVVETQITELVEERVAGVQGIDFITSSSEDGKSTVNVRFVVGRDVDAAANDIRDRVARIADDLPTEAELPEIQKVDSNEDVIMWLNLVSDRLSVPELTDYAERYLVDRFSVLDGVARVRVGGAQTFAMRIWLDRQALAARNLTVNDVEAALRAENVELPAGSVESRERQFTVRVARAFRSADDFAKLVLVRGADGYLVRLGDVARVERGPIEERTFFRGNGVPMVGLGITKQSTANTIAVARAAKAEAELVNKNLPEGMEIKQSFDTSIFVEGAINEVYNTLFIAIGLVLVVIFIFLGSLRATIVPAVAVPVSVVATFLFIYFVGFSINLLTLLALVLAIGLVVDDAIVVLENIYRRMEEYGESPLVASYRGTREVGFAVIATTLVLIAVFVPVAFLEGDVGRLFSEFAWTMAAAVAFSSIVALTLSPMLASKVLRSSTASNPLARGIDRAFGVVSRGYRAVLSAALKARGLTVLVFFVCLGATGWLYNQVPQEYAPKEDRGAFFVIVNGPEGASFGYIEDYMNEIEKRLMSFTETGEATRLLVRAPRSFGTLSSFNTGIAVFVLNDWDKRRSAWAIMDDVRKRLADLPGVRAFPVMRQGFGSAIQKPVQFVIGGGTYEELAAWRNIIQDKLNANNPGLVGIDFDYKETKPQLDIQVRYDEAAALGVTINAIGRTLETLLGSRRVNTYQEAGKEYDVVLEGERDLQRTPASLENIFVRSDRSGALIPLANLVTINERADSASLNRYNRVRAITLEANLADGYALGAALAHLEGLVREHLPAIATIDYKGQSLDFQRSGSSLAFVFAFGIFVVFLVLAAQFESFRHPFIILLTVPLATAGGLVGLYLTGGTINLYSQVGLIMLVGLAAKNGILIVEFANQLRDRGLAFDHALLEASAVRLRPILMTAITTAAGAVPLIVSAGAGAETRETIGIVVLWGVLVSTVLTLFVVPVAYSLLARGTGSPSDVARTLEAELASRPDRTPGQVAAPAE